jgi:hypothetical protein
MRAIANRIGKLGHRFGMAENEPRFLLIVTGAGSPPDSLHDEYVKILDEAGFLEKSGFCKIDFTLLPRGLTVKETKRFLRENGDRICGARAEQES